MLVLLFLFRPSPQLFSSFCSKLFQSSFRFMEDGTKRKLCVPRLINGYCLTRERESKIFCIFDIIFSLFWDFIFIVLIARKIICKLLRVDRTSGQGENPTLYWRMMGEMEEVGGLEPKASWRAIGFY